MPLYALDFCRYTARKTQECICVNDNKEEFTNNGPNSLLLLEWHKETFLSESDKPPVHSEPLFTSSNSRSTSTKLDKQENLDNVAVLAQQSAGFLF